jgi:hypothetical protein
MALLGGLGIKAGQLIKKHRDFETHLDRQSDFNRQAYQYSSKTFTRYIAIV